MQTILNITLKINEQQYEIRVHASTTPADILETLQATKISNCDGYITRNWKPLNPKQTLEQQNMQNRDILTVKDRLYGGSQMP